MMLRRRQIITVVSIAVVSFLIGTMLNVNLITTAKQDDDDSRPVWQTYVTGVNATALPDAWNVTVTNWPVSSSVTVWWYEHIGPGGVGSLPYNANGFSQLHVLVLESGLTGLETVRFWIYGALWNGTRNIFHAVIAAEITLDQYNPMAAITIPVPSDQFTFTAYTDYECEVSLSFYLTWA